MRNCLIVIPAYNPPIEMVEYVKNLLDKGFEDILVVDDGSADKTIFDSIKKIDGVHIFSHARNLGKGRGLKNSFNYILNEKEKFEKYIGIITVDSDGQHLVEDVVSVDSDMGFFMSKNSDIFNHTLFLGCRDFDSRIVPFKSKFGNKITRFIFWLFYGKKLKDTQTGLRGIPINLLYRYMDIFGERFEYETNMLIYSTRNGIGFREIDITTHYIDNNSESHFDAVRDSLKIYRLLFATFFKYVFSAVSSAVLDIGIFKILTLLLSSISGVVWISTIFARAISSLYNYNINRVIVFEDNKNIKNSVLQYYSLCAIQGIISAFFVSNIYRIYGRDLIWIKILVDGIIFMVNFFIQNFIIFKNKK